MKENQYIILSISMFFIICFYSNIINSAELNQEIGLEMLNTKKDCKNYCTASSELIKRISEAFDCADVSGWCCENGETPFLDKYRKHDFFVHRASDYLKCNNGWYYRIHEDCHKTKCGKGIGFSQMKRFTGEFYNAYCMFKGKIVRYKGNFATSGKYSEIKELLDKYCNETAYVKEIEECKKQCEEENSARKIVIDGKRIITIKDVLDTLTPAQIIDYLPKKAISGIYDPNMVYQ